MRQDIEFRPLKVNGYCRVCNKEVAKHTEKVFIFRMVRNATVICCVPCIKEMHQQVCMEE